MKKAVLCLCVLLLAAGLIYGIFRPAGASEPASTHGTGSSGDMTVLPEFAYNVEAIESGTVLEMVSFRGSAPVYDPLERPAEACIEGTVKNIYYTFLGGEAWTQADIQVSRSISGSLSRGCTVSVYFSGGFVSAEDYSLYYGGESAWQDCFLYFPPSSGTLPQEGDKGTYYISRADKSSPLPPGAFELAPAEPSEDNSMVK